MECHEAISSRPPFLQISMEDTWTNSSEELAGLLINVGRRILNDLEELTPHEGLSLANGGLDTRSVAVVAMVWSHSKAR